MVVEQVKNKDRLLEVMYESHFEPRGPICTYHYFASGAEREVRLVPMTGQLPAFNVGNTDVRFTKDQATFYAYDHLGNTGLTYTPTNFVMYPKDPTIAEIKINSALDYFPYGKVLREFQNGDQERYLTTQHERDQETDLDYRGARYYDNEVARFLSTDPWQDKYPAWSTYNYCMGNPIMFIDPTGKGADWVPEIKDNRLVVKKEEGDDAKSLAKFLDVSQETADQLYNSLDSKGRVDVGEFHGAWIINKALKHAKNHPDDYGGYFDNNYDCHESSLALCNGRSIDYDNIIEGYELSDELYHSGFYKDVTGEKGSYIFSRTLIRFGNTAGNTKHSATYLGTSQDGTVYTWSKNGNSDKPGIYTVDQLKEIYDAKIQGVGPEKGGGFYNLLGGFY